jgi:hydrogenase/urease accessory protein HupE
MKSNCKRVLATLLFLSPALAPSLANAHSLPGQGTGLGAGFSHPWQGYDHLIAMFAVGFWAAQHQGRAVWLIPLSFVGVMTLGGIVGACGGNLPGAEFLILLSVPVFGLLAAFRVRLGLRTSLVMVGFFALFHGLAHGQEMPGSASLVSFGSGFVLATLLLHGLGIVTARAAILLAACFVGNHATAQTTNNATPPTGGATNPPPSKIQLPAVVVTGRQDSLLGIADSATQGTTGASQLAERPILRVGEILETVPGVIITQHAGGGKANQYFLRGFNLDHGTDFAVFLDSMPLNLPTHAHGEGYSDMNAVIPELVQRLNFEKGPYYAEVGDFGSVGSAHLEFYQALPQSFVALEAGTYGFERAAFGISQSMGPGTLLYGAEAYHDDGPWAHADDYRKFNGLVTYSQGNEANGASVTARGYHGQWNSTDQVAASFAQTNFYGAIDPTDGGNSQRYSVQAEWHRHGGNSETKVMVYGFYYDLDLFSDFTYYLVDPIRGDQFEQSDKRWVAGLDARHTIYNQWFDREVENSIGLQVRNDWINNGLYQTENRVRVDKINADPDHGLPLGTILPAATRQDAITDTEVGFYAENKIQWGDKFRSVAALRGDLDYFDVTDGNPLNTGTSTSLLPSPKLSMVLGPWAKTEVYLQGGFSFHSNDGRGTTQTVNPDGTPTSKIAGLIQTRGGEIGVRTLALSHLQSTVSLWYLHSDSELQQDGDTGNTVASKQPSDRYGIEWGNYYTVTEHVSFDLDLADSVARFPSIEGDDAAPGSAGGKHVPEAVGLVLSSGVTLRDFHGFSASLRARFFGPRDLTSDGLYRSRETFLVNAEAGYQIDKTWRLSVEVLNLLNRRDHDIDYAYEARVTPAAAPVFQNVLHPVEPIQVRIGLTARF